jgi:hypothetical protein
MAGVKDHGQMATPADPTLAIIDVALSARVAGPLARERAPDHIVHGREATAGAVGRVARIDEVFHVRL